MAQYTITYSCGHEGTERLFGKIKDRQSYLKWAAENKVCPDCYRKQREAEGPEVYVRAVPRQAGVEVYVLNSYAVCEDLKARGYRFGEYSRPEQGRCLVGLAYGGTRLLATPKGWGKVLTEDAELGDEIKWCQSQGWRIVVVDELSSMLQSVIEGRLDLVPQQPEITQFPLEHVK